MAVELTIQREGGKAPTWREKAFYQDGVVYLPASDSEMMCATFDGSLLLEFQGHPYLSIDWFIREYPQDAAKYREIKLWLMTEATKDES